VLFNFAQFFLVFFAYSYEIDEHRNWADRTRESLLMAGLTYYPCPRSDVHAHKNLGPEITAELN